MWAIHQRELRISILLFDLFNADQDCVNDRDSE